MSYQVGLACYADLPSAGAAACAQFTPLNSVTGGVDGAVINATCSSSDASGVLTLKIVSSPISGGSPSTTYNTISPIYNPCQYSDFVDAGLVIFAAILAVWASCWGLHQLYKMLHWSRSDTQ